jgi:hypothetical protein
LPNTYAVALDQAPVYVPAVKTSIRQSIFHRLPISGAHTDADKLLPVQGPANWVLLVEVKEFVPLKALLPVAVAAVKHPCDVPLAFTPIVA